MTLENKSKSASKKNYKGENKSRMQELHWLWYPTESNNEYNHTDGRSYRWKEQFNENYSDHMGARAFMLFCHVTDGLPLPILQPLPTLHSNADREKQPKKMRNTWPKHFNHFWFGDLTRQWAIT